MAVVACFVALGNAPDAVGCIEFPGWQGVEAAQTVFYVTVEQGRIGGRMSQGDPIVRPVRGFGRIEADFE